MPSKKLIVSHAPFWHDGSGIAERSYHILLATLPAVIGGFYYFGVPALAVVGISVSSAMLWELAYCRLAKTPITIGDGNAAVIGMLFAMLMPATTPWWLIIVGTLLAVLIGKLIFGGIGGNSFSPVMLAVAIMMVSWKSRFDFDATLLNYDFDFTVMFPLAAVKRLGAEAAERYPLWDLLIGRQVGGVGATFGLGLILGGIYLILRGFIRWEIALSFLGGVFFTAALFNAAEPAQYAGPWFHLLTGYTLIGAFFLATDDSSSPVNFIPMLIYGAGGGLMTVLIRNIGAYIDGVVFAILAMNMFNPLLDKIRPKAIGKVV